MPKAQKRKTAPRKAESIPATSVGPNPQHRKDFEQLLDDAVLGVSVKRQKR